MRIFRCGCGLLSILSLLPILLLLVGAVAVLNDPHMLPGPLGDLAASVRGDLAQVALGGDLGSGDLSVHAIGYDAATGGTLTVTLATTGTKAPAAKDLAPAFKAVGGHLAGPLPLTDGSTAKVVVVIERASDGKRLTSFRAKATDIAAYATGKLTTAAFLKRVTTP